MYPAFQPVRLKPGPLKDLPIRKEVDFCPRLFCLPHGGKKAVYQLHGGNTPSVSVVMDVTVFVHLNIHML